MAAEVRPMNNARAYFAGIVPRDRGFVPKKDPKSVFFLREAEFQQPV